MTDPINPANVPHMSREELEDACAHLKLVWIDSDSDSELREAVLWHVKENARLANPEETRDERSAADVYAGTE
jgi:hypothetical protein